MPQESPPDDERIRLDHALVERGLFASRARARDAILRGTVMVDGETTDKPARMVTASAVLNVDDAARRYVSRSAVKLVAGLDAFAIDVSGRRALDIGASTGGFTQVLLERGASGVHAVDVGHGQLDPAIAGDPRVVSREGLNARNLTRADLDGQAPEIVVSDVSFISLKLAIPPALELAAHGADCVLLVKPQFEAGRKALGKGGILRDPLAGEAIAHELAAWLGGQPGWRSLGLEPAPIAGGDGNREWLLCGRKDR